MLEKLSNLAGVSGFDEKVREAVLSEITPFCENIEVTKDGNILAWVKGEKQPKKKMMISAHTDEVGFMVKDITKEGYLKIESVGGIDSRILLSQRVLVGKKSLPGVVGIKAVHMLSKEEREKTVKEDQLYVDIGALSYEDALKYVRRGDPISFDSKFVKLSNNRVKGKALDDRAGVALLIQLIQLKPQYDFIACFNSLEEIGLKGAITAANRILPDVALILEGTTCSDLPGTKAHAQSTVLGGGVALSIADRGSFSNREFNELIEKAAKEKKIQFQYKRTNMGGNDAGAIQLAGQGVKTAVLSVPVRYIHSPVSVMDLGDYESAFLLAQETINRIGGLQ